MNPQKLSTVFTMAVWAAIVCAPTTNANTSVEGILHRAVSVAMIDESQESQVLAMYVDVLPRGSGQNMYFRLGYGDTYCFTVVGDEERIQDMDDTHVAVVHIVARLPGKYRVEIRGYRMSHRDGFYGVVFSRTENSTGIVSVKPVLRQVVPVVGLLERCGSQVLAVYMDCVARDGEKTFECELPSSPAYRCVALGDEERIQDIDVRVYDPLGNWVGEDRDETNVAAVEFRAELDGKYQFQVTPYEIYHDDGFCGLIISRD